MSQQPATLRLDKKSLRQLATLPLDQLFDNIYAHRLWGQSSQRRFYSGDGSHNAQLVAPYVMAVREFFASQPRPPVVVDLGCGDFQVGSQLLDQVAHMYACDLAQELIADNRKHYHLDKLNFICLDASNQPLPDGDVLLVRQVLQHLSNDVIASILSQFTRYRYIIVSEHLPQGRFVANRDKPNGPDTRLRFNSGVVLTEAPFDFAPARQQLLCEVTDPQHGGVIRSMLYQT
ncbi:MAG: class I SAM-dependent methyltransferase [Chromatiales bacterium]|jgi:hypothetical protein